LPPGMDAIVADKYREARRVSESMINLGEFDPI
jgi:hypothetical protein